LFGQLAPDTLFSLPSVDVNKAEDIFKVKKNDQLTLLFYRDMQFIVLIVTRWTFINYNERTVRKTIDRIKLEFRIRELCRKSRNIEQGVGPNRVLSTRVEHCQ
jgi:hypothetical protein